ncbi:MAG: response regulator [SAR324 cluster bacterium]|nr:response regulator [SAR324 cluster bacterium]
MRQFRFRFVIGTAAVTLILLLLLSVILTENFQSGLGTVIVLWGISIVLLWPLSSWFGAWYASALFENFHTDSNNDGDEKIIENPDEYRSIPQLAFVAKHFNYMNSRIQEQGRQLEEKTLQAEEAQEIKTQFVRRMASDLRGVLNALVGYTNLLVKEERSDQNQSVVRHLHSKVHDLFQLSTNWQTSAEIDSGLIRRNEEWIELKPFVNTLVGEANQTTFSSQSCILKDYPEVLPEKIFYDPRYLKEMLLTLLRTSLTHASQGLITLTLRTQERYLYFTVHDPDMVLKTEDIQKIFQRNLPLEEQYRLRYAGEGLGLTLLREVAEFLGGHASIQSDEQRGTFFEISLLLEKTHTMDQTFDKKDLDVKKSFGPETLFPIKPESANRPLNESEWDILCVDDDPTSLFLLEQFMKEEQYHVRIANNGKEAIAEVETKKPDLIFMDIMMPGVDGTEARQKIKANPKFSDVPVIAITSLSTGLDHEQLLEKGFDDHVSKPFNIGQIKAILAQHLKSKAP